MKLLKLTASLLLIFTLISCNSYTELKATENSIQSKPISDVKTTFEVRITDKIQVDCPIKKLPDFVCGKWEIYKYIKHGGSALKETEVESFIGKRIIFSKNNFVYDENTLFFGTEFRFLKYELVVTIPQEKTIYPHLNKVTLWSYDLEGAQENKVEQVNVFYDEGKNAYYSFEITNKKELNIYYDGHFFFLKKVQN